MVAYINGTCTNVTQAATGMEPPANRVLLQEMVQRMTKKENNIVANKIEEIKHKLKIGLKQTEKTIEEWCLETARKYSEEPYFNISIRQEEPRTKSN